MLELFDVEVVDNNKLKITDRTQIDAVEKFMEYTPGYLSEFVTWNDVMPVVDKIENLKGKQTFGMFDAPIRISLLRGECTFEDDDYELLCYSKSEVRLKSLWISIIQFVKWYNEFKEEDSL